MRALPGRLEHQVNACAFLALAQDKCGPPAAEEPLELPPEGGVDRFERLAELLFEHPLQESRRFPPLHFGFPKVLALRCQLLPARPDGLVGGQLFRVNRRDRPPLLPQTLDLPAELGRMDLAIRMPKQARIYLTAFNDQRLLYAEWSAKAEAAEATLKNGVLTLILPKSEKGKTVAVEIEDQTDEE